MKILDCYLMTVCLFCGGRLSREEGAEEDVAAPKKFLLKERRRSARIGGRMSAALVLRQGRHGDSVAEPSPGEIIDISLYGAGVCVDQIRVGSAHLFYSPQDNPSHVLHLEVEPPPDEDGAFEPISIPVRPVRFDRVLEDENAPKPFHIGVEFLSDASDKDVRLLVRLVGQKQRGKGWWRTVIDSLCATAVDK